ncbi:MAG: beta-lactamase family protein [Bacteroidia bacterium]|nr:beta-lactamase family protein [Bacteroidia bacterium]
MYRIAADAAFDIQRVTAFPTVSIPPSSKPWPVAQLSRNKPLPPLEQWIYPFDGKGRRCLEKSKNLRDFMRRTGTTALIVCKNDTIVHESYAAGGHRRHTPQIYSTTKSFISALVGIALEEGAFTGLDQKVSDFFPEFADDRRRDITIGHLLHMQSGLNHEDWKYIGRVIRLYYAARPDGLIRRSKSIHPPGTHFAYKSLDTQILGMCLERATGKPIEKYFYEKLWNPMGAEAGAKWVYSKSKKRGGSAKMYGGLCATARDMLRFGLLYLHYGQANGLQVVPRRWTELPAYPDSSEGKWWGYSYGWWRFMMMRDFSFSPTPFFATGLGWQRIFIDRQTNTVIVRQGKKRGHVEWSHAFRVLSRYPKEPLVVETSPRNALPLVGRYRTLDGSIANVRYSRGMLTIKTSGKKMEFLPETDLSYACPEHRAKALFVRENGKIAALQLDGWGKSDFFYKVVVPQKQNTDLTGDTDSPLMSRRER